MTDMHSQEGIRIRSPSKRAAAAARLRPPCHWGQQNWDLRNCLFGYNIPFY